MAIKDYSTEPGMNTTISGINIAEGCAPSGINNAIRQLMADVKAGNADLDTTLRALIAQEVAKCLKTSGGTMTGPIYSNLTGANRSPLQIDCKDVDVTALPSENILRAINVVDANNYIYGTLAFEQRPNGEIRSYLRSRRKRADGTTYEALLTLHADEAGTGRNTGRVNGNEIITSAGGTVTGSLTSTFSPCNFIAKNSTLDSTVTPTSNTYTGYEMRDKNDKRLAWAGYRKSVNGRDYYEVQVVGTNGNLTLYNDGELTTNKGTVLTLAASWSDGAGNWYRKYSDGWIEQGGHMPTTGTSSNVVFNVPFTSTNYTLTLGEVLEGESNDTEGLNATTGVSSLTTTGFRASKVNTRPTHWYACGY